MEEIKLKKETNKLISTLLTVTTAMSMLTAIPVGAVDVVSESNTTQSKAQSEIQSQTPNTVQDENNINQIGKTGDRTVEYGISEEATVIDSVSEYYKIKGKKYKVPSGSTKANLPSSVDNSQSIYFPEIGNQGQIGSCGAWAQAYYQFTYEMNRLQGIATTPENAFSPKWLYNIYSGAWDFGSVSEELFQVMAWQGLAPMSLVPYDDDYKSWMPTEEIWSTAIKYKVKSYQYFDELGLKDTRITSADDSDLDAIKTALSNGEVLTYSTFISSWKTNMIRTNPMAPENYKYEGQEIITAQDSYEGSHRMALVGYNDNIWTDINRNFQVDDGEMGAFKVANSWGYDYGNDGFMWIAYDALNEGYSSVEGAPTYDDKSRIFEYIARMEAEPVKENSDMYLRCTLSTLNRSDFDVYLIAEKDGTIYTEVGLAPTKYQLLAGGCALDGTNNLSDGTLAFALNNVVPDISSENFSEYSWSARFVDKENNGDIITIKDVAIVDAGENKVYTPQSFTPFTLDGSEKTVDFTKSTSKNIAIYYVGYYNPTIHYKVGEGQWKTTKMEANTERYGYTHKLLIPSEDITEVTLYFTDEDGAVDDNNGKYYTAVNGYNCYVTEGQAKPLSASVTMNSIPDVTKLMDFTAKAEGGYAPYRYEFVLTKLDDGTEEVREYDYNEVAQWYMWFEGDYRLTVNIKDQSNKIITKSIDFNVENKHFEFKSLTAKPDKHILTGDTIEFTAESEFESAVDFGACPSMYDIVIRKANTNEVVHSVCKRADVSDFDYKYSINYLSWVPTQAGNYTITISSTDNNGEYAEKTLEFTVHEYNGTIIGDANNDKQLNISDALAIMKYVVANPDSPDIWLSLSDCNDDKLINVRDVIFLLRYLISAENTANVGKVNYRELTTE